MSIVITESDNGTKNAAKKAAVRTHNKLSTGGYKKLGEWWKHVEQTAIARCPKQFGALSRTIRIENIGKNTPPYTKESYVYINDKEELLNKMLVAGGEIDMIKGIYVDYAQAVHDGHISTGGNWVMANPFLDIAIQESLPLLDLKEKQMLDDAVKEWARD